METVNEIFAIQIEYQVIGMPWSSMLISASDYFDEEFVADVPLAEIRIDAPPRHDDLRRFIAHASDLTAITWLRITIQDRRSLERRICFNQWWSGHWISMSCGTSPFHEPRFNVVLELQVDSGMSHIIKLTLDTHTCGVVGHSLVNNTVDNSFQSVLGHDAWKVHR